MATVTIYFRFHFKNSRSKWNKGENSITEKIDGFLEKGKKKNFLQPKNSSYSEQFSLPSSFVATFISFVSFKFYLSKFSLTPAKCFLPVL